MRRLSQTIVLALFLLLACRAEADLNGLRFESPFYEMELTSTPVRIAHLGWDLTGQYTHRRLLVPQIEGSKWASSLYVGKDFYTDTLSGDAASVEYLADNALVLRDIAMIPGLTADWYFLFEETYFEHRIIFKVSQPLSGLYDLGHQWASHRLAQGGNQDGDILQGDNAGFEDWGFIRDEEFVLKMDLIDGSTSYQANRYFNGAGVVWQNFFSGGSTVLSPGNYEGGRWRCGVRRPSELGLGPNDISIGYFEHPGKYLKDFFFLKHDGLWHLFYNVGEAGAVQDWQDAGNEKQFGHATSLNLRDWTIHEPVLPVVPNSWEGQVVSAPSILFAEGQWQMIYTGFDDRVFGLQQVGLAQSANLFDWTRRPENPLYQGPSWTNWASDRWADCRDADLVAANGSYYIYTMVTTSAGQGAIAIARSTDLLNWTDQGAAVVVDGTPESPVVFERNGTWFLITTSNAPACYASDDPERNGWTQIPFDFPPAPGFWSAFEVFEDNGEYTAAAFRWTNYGNYIKFWNVEWNSNQPTVRYTGMPVSGAGDVWQLMR